MIIVPLFTFNSLCHDVIVRLVILGQACVVLLLLLFPTHYITTDFNLTKLTLDFACWMDYAVKWISMDRY